MHPPNPLTAVKSFANYLRSFVRYPVSQAVSSLYLHATAIPARPALYATQQPSCGSSAHPPPSPPLSPPRPRGQQQRYYAQHRFQASESFAAASSPGFEAAASGGSPDIPRKTPPRPPPPTHAPPNELILRPPSPPGSRGNRHEQRPPRQHIFSQESLTTAAAAFVVGGLHHPVHTTASRVTATMKFPARALGIHNKQQSRLLSIPAVAAPAPSVDWFKKSDAPSIFELFEKAVPTTRRTYQFANAASAMPKRRRGPPMGKPQTDENSDGEPYLSAQVGEDAYFVRSDSMGVSDGVGGWAKYKEADPALYSRKLMHYASAELAKLDDFLESEYSADDYYAVDPKEVLQKSYDQTNKDVVAAKLLGSATALIAVLRDDELRIANLGDCGVLIIRNLEPLFRSEEQQHSFNFPFQLGTGSRDSPRDAQSFSVKIQEGDIVIMGSDGMFDNVFDEDVVDIIRKVLKKTGCTNHPSDVDPKKISDALLARAWEVAEDSRYGASPFQTRAIQEGLYFHGGKMDDVTVLTGVVRLSEDSPDRR